MEMIIIGALYGLVLVSFRLLGGLGRAAEAIREWGGATGRLPAASSS
jgi:hypothetical protein